jgi:hypothetical protein
MEFAIAAGLVVAGIIVFLMLKRKQSSKAPSAEFVCRNCGHKHCECETKP